MEVDSLDLFTVFTVTLVLYHSENIAVYLLRSIRVMLKFPGHHNLTTRSPNSEFCSSEYYV